jgi:hypothetical protein
MWRHALFDAYRVGRLAYDPIRDEFDSLIRERSPTGPEVQS